jgi:hypothetical protein
MRIDIVSGRSFGRAGALALAVLAVLSAAAQAPARRGGAAAAPLRRTAPAASPTAAPAVSPSNAPAPPEEAAVAPPVEPAPVLMGQDTPFSAAPSAAFRILVDSDATELKLRFEVAPKGLVRVFLRRERGVSETVDPEEQLMGSASGSAVFAVAKTTSPALRSGTYRLRLEAAAATGGFFCASQTKPPARPAAPSLADVLRAPPPWLQAILSVASLLCLGLLFAIVPRPIRRLLNQLHDSVVSQAQLLTHIETAVDRMPQAIALASPAPQLPPSPQPKLAVSLAPRLERLMETEPMLVVARLVRQIAARSGAEMEAQAARIFPGYLQALGRAERLRIAALHDAAEVTGAEWDGLNRAIGALQTRHNPRFFLDFIAEAGRLRMPEKDQMLAALGIEEVVPSAGSELSGLEPYQVEQTTGAGSRCILERVLASGYRSRETGEVYRKPAITVRLASDVSGNF